MRVSPFCLGRVRSPETIAAAFDAGINFFFLSADLHWPLYEETRRGLERLIARSPHIREQIVVAVAIYPTQPEFCRLGLQEVVKAIPGLQTVDVAVAGGVYGYEFPIRLPVYQKHRDHHFAGVRAIGASFHDREVAVTAINHNTVDIAFARYNPAHPGAREDLFPHVDDSNGGTLLYNFTSTDGILRAADRAPAPGPDAGRRQPTATDYYRFALSRPELDGLLCSLSTPEEIRVLAGALEKGPLSAEEEEYLMDLALQNSGAVSSVKASLA